MRPSLRSLLPKSYRQQVGSPWVFIQALRGFKADRWDMMQGAYGSPPILNAEFNAQLVTLEELRNSGAEHWDIEVGYQMPELAFRVFPSTADGAIARLHDLGAKPIVVTKLLNALVADGGGWIRTEGGRWVSDHWPAPNYVLPILMPGLKAAADKPARRLAGTTALLASPNHDNYYHWLHQILPQIDAIRRSGRPIDRWLVTDEKAAYVRDILTAMGIEPMVEEATETPILCETLMVAPPPTMGALLYGDGWPLRTIRDLYLPKEAIQPWRKIYLRRGSSDTRPVVNADDVDALLAKRGFEVRTMNGLTIAEQARLMAETAALVAPHGAGLANVIFCAPGTKIVEMLPRNWPSPLYGMIGGLCGLEHVFVPGEEASLPRLKVRSPVAGMKAPIRAFAQALDSLNL